MEGEGGWREREGGREGGSEEGREGGRRNRGRGGVREKETGLMRRASADERQLTCPGRCFVAEREGERAGPDQGWRCEAGDLPRRVFCS